MYKELIISIIIVVLIVGIDVISNNYLKDAVQILTTDLGQLRENTKNEEQEKEQEKIEEILDKWENKYERLAFFIEHNELEKVKTKIINVKSNIEMQENEQTIQNIDETIYLLEHIRDKDSLNLKDIF